MTRYFFLLALVCSSLHGQIKYPETKQVPAKVLPGHELEEQYQWLEPENPETAAWSTAQGQFARKFLDSYPSRGEIEKSITPLYRVPDVGIPKVVGSKAFFTKKEPDDNRPRLFLQDGERGRVLIDLVALDKALDWWYVSPTGRRIAYGLSSKGSEDSTLHVMDVESGKEIDTPIPHTKFASLSWLPDESGFYYSRFNPPGPDASENQRRKIYLHTIGKPSAGDPVVFSENGPPRDWPVASVSRDGRWLLVHIPPTATEYDVFLKDLRDPKGAFRLVNNGKKGEHRCGILNGQIWMATTYNAPRGRLMIIDPEAPEDWREVVPESKDSVLRIFDVFPDRIAIDYMRNVSSRIALFDHKGSPIGDISFANFRSVTLGGSHPGSTTMYFSTVGFDEPATIYRQEGRSLTPSVWHQGVKPNDSIQIHVERRKYRSKDGTEIPMFLAYHGELGSKRPVLLYGYGGFNNASSAPSFTNTHYALMARGVVLAVPSLRGGSEFGSAWHRAGMLANKQNVFDDMIAAAEYLVKEEIADKSRLAIKGGSNGGLLCLAVITQRPELFRAGVCMVPLADMLRYTKDSKLGRLWTPELGDPDKPADFEYLTKYSPYHNVRRGTVYPALLFTVGAEDGRVAPFHARKMVAALQAAQTASDSPILLRIDEKSGHGAGKPTDRSIAEGVDIVAFLSNYLRL